MSQRSWPTSSRCWPSTVSRTSTGSSCVPPTRVESTFSTVGLRARETRRAATRAADVAMPYKLLCAAEERWRRVDRPEPAAVVRAGARFIDGRSVEHHDTQGEEDNQKQPDGECAA